MSRCGVPLELQIEGKDCCYEVVEAMVNVLWCTNEANVSLECSIKAEVISCVSKMCMRPGGMTDSELNVAIAQEIANRIQ